MLTASVRNALPAGATPLKHNLAGQSLSRAPEDVGRLPAFVTHWQAALRPALPVGASLQNTAADNAGRRAASQCVTNAGGQPTSFGPLDHELLRINGICWFVTVGAAIGRPQRWAWYALRFDGKAQNAGTFRAANGRPYGGIWIAANCNFTTFSGRGAQRM